MHGARERLVESRSVSERRLHHADPAAYRHAMRTLSSGVAIVACGEGDRARRLHRHLARLAVADPADPVICPCRARPRRSPACARPAPSPSVCSPRGTRRWRSSSADAAARTAPGFAEPAWVTLATGAPVLADALAAFDCLIEEVIERHSHAIVLGAVVSLKEGSDEPALSTGAAPDGPTR